MRLDLSLTVPLQHKHFMQKKIFKKKGNRKLLKDCREKSRVSFPAVHNSAGMLQVKRMARQSRFYVTTFPILR